ncbi:MAG: polymer-forming cytoskeletal protein [Burkholderiaceae bacterium]|nr:MAG: polymer-forming cytoskeletal protein [Burkholderiaceae bacterium]TBR76794.1 MAG: polymer-forming cytoskeletal protein [Burkholderiaceae bacterium]
MNIPNISPIGNSDEAMPAFLGRNAAQAQPNGADKSRATSPSFIDESATLTGDICVTNRQDLHVDGCVVGCIYHPGKVIIGETGIVIGSIYAEQLDIRGVVDAPQGEILVNLLRVQGTSRIETGKVTVSEGCLNYEAGAFMSAQMGMLPDGEVKSRINALVQPALEKALEQRAAADRLRHRSLPRQEGVSAVALAAVPEMVDLDLAANERSGSSQVAESSGY